MDDIDPMFLKFLRIAHTRELKDLRSIDGTSTQDDFFFGGHTVYFSPFFKLYTDRFFSFKKYFVYHGPRHYRQIGTILHRMNVGSGGTSSTGSIDRLIKFSKS